MTLFKGYFHHFKNDRNFSGSKIVTIIKPRQLCAYKTPVGSWKLKLHFCFFSIHTYTHVQFEQLHKYIQKRNKIYKKWYTQKQSLDIKLFGIFRNKKK